MKRGTPLRRTPMPPRKTPMPRGKVELKRTTSLNPISEQRRKEKPQRDACRAVVLERDPTCRYPGCRLPSEDVHELHRGAGRHADYLDPSKCIGLCRPHHSVVTLNPDAAHELGLAYRSWETVPDQNSGLTNGYERV